MFSIASPVQSGIAEELLPVVALYLDFLALSLGAYRKLAD